VFIKGKWIRAISIGFIALFLWYLAFSKIFSERKINPFSDLWDYAQQGRELYRGHGFTSLFTYPVVLPYEKDGHFYNLWRPPLYPYLVSQSFRFTNGPSIHALIYLTGLFYILTVILVTLITETIFDKHIAWMAGFFYAVSMLALQAGISGLSEPVFTFILTLFFFQYYQLICQKHHRTRNYIGMGILFGLGWLLRGEMIFFVIPTPYFLWRDDPSKIKLGVFLFLSLIVLLMCPWWIRNYYLTGNPFFNMSTDLFVMFTPSYPGWSWFRFLDKPMSILNFLITHPSEIARKFIFLLIHNFRNLLYLHFLFVSLFFISFIKVYSIPLRKFRVFVGMNLIFYIFCLSFLESEIRFFLCFLPTITIFGTEVLIRWCAQINFSKTFFKQGLLFTISLFLILPALYWGITESSNKAEGRKQDSEIFQFVSQYTAKESVLVIDIPDQLAFYSDRHTIWLPSINDLPIIQKKYAKINGILITPAIQPLHTDMELNKWEEIFRNHDSITGFELVRIFPDGSLYYISTTSLR
jgi:4-amino-4-deoxy-L-arabinose transferase-like glycosyltransferase